MSWRQRLATPFSEIVHRAMTRNLLSSICTALALLGVAAAAKGAPPPDANPSLAPWFQSLQRPGGGGSCCAAADCRRVQSRIGRGGYEVLLKGGVWVPVPPDKVLHRENPTGEAVACTKGPVVLCFVPPPES